MLIKNILSLWAVQKPSHGLDIILRLEFADTGPRTRE